MAAAEFRYQPQGPRRFVVIRRLVPEEPSWQLDLFQLGRFTSQVFTNLALTPLALWQFYNDRAEAELVIREMKEAYALGKIPTGDWQANRAYFHLVVFAYTFLNWFLRVCLREHWQRLTLPTIASACCSSPPNWCAPQASPCSSCLRASIVKNSSPHL